MQVCSPRAVYLDLCYGKMGQEWGQGKAAAAVWATGTGVLSRGGVVRAAG